MNLQKKINRTSDEIRKFPNQFDSPFEIDKYSDVMEYLYSSSENVEELNYYNQMFYDNVVGSYLHFMLGRFYIFDYDYETKDLKNKKFVDIRPLVFVLDSQVDNTKKIIKGINFNLLPIEIRINFLQIYFNIYKQIIDSDLWYIERGEYNLYKIQHKEIETLYKTIFNVLPNISNAIRYWKYDRIQRDVVKVVRLDDYNILFQYKGYEKSIIGSDWAFVQNNTINKK